MSHGEVAGGWRERLTEEFEWPAGSETDRVLAVLEALDANGVVARADFTCCGSCGAAEIGAEARPGDRGYVFFHRQDTENAFWGGGLYLSYGTFDGSDPATVGHEVVAAMTAAGVRTEWNGSVDLRIHVMPEEWDLRLA